VAWYLIALVLLVGIWGLITKANLIKKLVALSIMNSAIVMFFIYFGSQAGSEAPIGVEGGENMVDPLPQALMLTAIVVGVCVTALAVVLVYRLYRKFGTLDMREIERRAWGGDHS
jgi:multicomponent Na+:H+ antiporter subunit C